MENLTTTAQRTLQRTLSNQGWSIQEFTIDLTAPQALKVDVRKNNGLRIVATINTGRGSIEFSQRQTNLEMSDSPQARITPRVQEDFLGRESVQGNPASVLASLADAMFPNDNTIAQTASIALRLNAKN